MDVPDFVSGDRAAIGDPPHDDVDPRRAVARGARPRTLGHQVGPRSRSVTKGLLSGSPGTTNPFSLPASARISAGVG